MDEYIQKAFAARSFTGFWKIQDRRFPQELLGELLYDPIKGHPELTLYGICLFPVPGESTIPVITGTTTAGEKVSVFDSIVIDATSGKGEIISRKTVFSFMSFYVGDKCFSSKEVIRLKKFSFRCSNLEAWSCYRPIRPHFSSRKKRGLGSVVFPPGLLLYEDDLVRIKLETTINQSMQPTSFKISYHHELIISARGNRKLPYYGNNNSILYYEKIIQSFFYLVIGKHVLPFNRIGTVSKQRIVVPVEKLPSLSRKKLYSFERIEFFNACKIDEEWVAPIRPQKTLVHHRCLPQAEWFRIIKKFFDKYSQFGFVLDDWKTMRNRSSYTNYSLPEMLYNFEGLHRSLYPECDTSAGYKAAINAIHAISPFKDYDRLINNKNHELPFRQRLQDILLVKTDSIFQFLSVSQRLHIIDDLVKTRNNAAHKDKASTLPFSKIVSYIFLCEELIAIMIFQCIGLKIKKIHEILQDGLEWLDLKDMLLKDFGEEKS